MGFPASLFDCASKRCFRGWASLIVRPIASNRFPEIAKGLLHDPRVLLLDEPSTGLDPGARLDLWRYLNLLREEAGVTVLVTTHLMEEAERCDRLAILDSGKLVALGAPDELRRSIGGECLTIESPAPEDLSRRIGERFDVRPALVGSQIRLEVDRGHDFIGQVLESFGPDISSISLGKPTLEDVFVQRTGPKFWEEATGVGGRGRGVGKEQK
jgi:ABC-2 type transport system ATP-binding protein